LFECLIRLHVTADHRRDDVAAEDLDAHGVEQDKLLFAPWPSVTAMATILPTRPLSHRPSDSTHPPRLLTTCFYLPRATVG